MTTHHYMFSLATIGGFGEKAGQYYIKHGIVHWTSELNEKIAEVIFLKNDKLFPNGITYKEACDIENVTEKEMEIINSINPLFMAAKVNLCTVHKFMTEGETPTDWFEMIVSNAHKRESFKKLLKDSEI